MAQVRVGQGDTLWEIAKRNPAPGKTVTQRIREIAAASGISDPNKIKPGQMLIVPGGQDTPMPRPRPAAGAAISGARQSGRGPDMRGTASTRPASPGRAPSASREFWNERGLGSRGTPETQMSIDAGGRAKQDAPPSPYDDWTREFDTPGPITMANEGMGVFEGGAPPAAASPPAPATPAVGNMGPDSGRMADLLMSGAGTADQVMGLPDMNAPAAFPDSGAETPIADAMVQQPAVIGPQFNETSFGAMPQGGADPELEAMLADPIKRQMIIQALMQPGGGM